MAISRTNLYHLIDQLPDTAIRFAEKMLEAMMTEFPPLNEQEEAKAKLMKMLATAPVDDELITEEERQSNHIARANISNGEGMALDEFKKELDI